MQLFCVWQLLLLFFPVGWTRCGIYTAKQQFVYEAWNWTGNYKTKWDTIKAENERTNRCLEDKVFTHTRQQSRRWKKIYRKFYNHKMMMKKENADDVPFELCGDSAFCMANAMRSVLYLSQTHVGSIFVLIVWSFRLGMYEFWWCVYEFLHCVRERKSNSNRQKPKVLKSLLLRALLICFNIHFRSFIQRMMKFSSLFSCFFFNFHFFLYIFSLSLPKCLSLLSLRLNTHIKQYGALWIPNWMLFSFEVRVWCLCVRVCTCW